VIAAQGASSLLRGQESERWRAWANARRGQLTDAVRQTGDMGPVWVDVARHGREFLKHPRSFVRSFLR
jgi:D-aspartate ligase